MAFYLEKAIFINRAPFEHLELDFKEKGINVLSAVNGMGKTTILSYIVDALFEMAKPAFNQEFEGKEHKYYRISSAIYNIDMGKPSYVYLRFKNSEDDTYRDYLDIRNNCTEEDYNNAIIIANKIEFNQIRETLKTGSNVKHWSSINNENEKVEEIFKNNVLTYFPAYRYESPGYLNDPYSVTFEYKKVSSFVGELPNPLEVVSDITDLSNWILDVLLDLRASEQHLIIQTKDGFVNQVISGEESPLWNNLNTILSNALFSKKYQGIVRFGIGGRNRGATRICIMNDIGGKSIRICPSIFNLSSGELSLISLFGEVLRQADNLKKNIKLDEIQGIVLIDEVDKHLHIRLQKEILPKLFKLFPNTQFIVSSHSPFLNMGLADEAMERTQIIDLDNNGIVCEPTNNDLYKEVYEMMVNENQRFADRYNNLVNQIKSNTKPIIITEGKTDYRHIKKAIEILERNDVDVDFCQVPDNWGSSKLKEMLESLSRIKQQRIVIGIFDRDESDYLSYLDVENQQFKVYGNSNVYALAIPLVNENVYGNFISIEHYYNKHNLLKEEPVNHRRLYLGEEFYASGNSKDGHFQTKISKIQRKVEINGVIDEKVYASDDLEQTHSLALSKEAFVSLIENDDNFTADFDFTNFNHILNLIKSIVELPLL